MTNICVVFVCNVKYFDKFIFTCSQLITNGQYKGDICLVIGDDLLNNDLLNCDLIKNNNIIIKYFPNIQFTDYFIEMFNSIERPPHWREKIFQYHKYYLFNIYFKRWDYIFYLDCGITILSDISPMINLIEENTFLANSDAYPTYERKLIDQFCQNDIYLEKLNHNFNLKLDYPQTTIMLYDTKLIEQNTFHELLVLTLQYPISVSNDQGILALYFTNIKPVFKQIKINEGEQFYYDYMRRNWNNKYIMVKIDWVV